MAASSGATPSPAESVGSTSGSSGSDVSDSLGGPGGARAAAAAAVAAAASTNPRRPTSASAVGSYPGIEVPIQPHVSHLHGSVAEGHVSAVVPPTCSKPAPPHGTAHVVAEEGKSRRPWGEMLEV